ncbi:SAM and SH3 domain-containing protein 1-like isoform X3 [Acanthaster planci]|uniref:SAM and SH3 domain-containing protein 1-like isoform X3 n=1 Tax=Acanthaster planci TaxID=133434 RepID=A0A8B7Y9A9_ACAPL|nr:SAM and SH3 domain-containing protein 1-like isoform X3 [Acanthaster planci]
MSCTARSVMVDSAMADPENNIVREWLRTLDLAHHLDSFIDNGYDDLETCKQIGEEDMDAIGVQDPRQREELRQAVARLKQEGGTAVYFTLMGPDTDYIYEEDVTVDYGYAEDEDEKVHSLLEGGRSGICDCRSCECLQESPFEVQPQCYLDRQRWKWTEHHLRRGSFESAAEYRRAFSEHSSSETLATKPRSASAVERGGFMEAIGGMSPHEQQRRMFRSLKESGDRQHSGSSLTSTGSDSSSGPTSPEHAMSTTTEDGAAFGMPETKKSRASSLKNFMRFHLSSKPKEESVSPRPTRKTDFDSKYDEEIKVLMNQLKEGKLTQEEVCEKGEQLKRDLEMQHSKPTLVSSGNESPEGSPITPSDIDSACGTEGPSDESTPSQHNYDLPPDSFESSPFSRSSSSLDNPVSIRKDSRQHTERNPLADEDVFTGPPPPGDILEHGGLVLENRHAKTASQSGEDLEDVQDTMPESGQHGVKRGSLPSLNKGEYLEPSPVFHKRGRSPSSPADPTSTRSDNPFKQLFKRDRAKKSWSSSPDGSGTDVLSEASDGSLERNGTIGSSTSSSSKSSGGAEHERKKYDVDPRLLDSQGEYCGPYLLIGTAKVDTPLNPHDPDMLPLKAGVRLYVTENKGSYWEGVQAKRRGLFKFIHFERLSQEELEKEKLRAEMPCEEGEDVQVTPSFANLKELLERIECEQYYTILHLHDFGSLEQFKFLEEGHLESLSITDPTHIVKLTTAAQMLRDPKAGKDRAASQQLHCLLWPTRDPRGRMTVRDSGFFASTETCMSVDSSGFHRCSEAGTSLIEECETVYPGKDGATSSSDDTLQENSNVNNSNCINALRSQNASSAAGRAGNSPCRPGMNGHQLPGSPSCLRKEGNGSASPLAHHVCRVHSNGATKCGGQHHFTGSPAWNSPVPPRDSHMFMHRHLMPTFSDPGSALNSPQLRPLQKSTQRCPLQCGHSVDHQCPSPDVVPKFPSEDMTRWRKSELVEMYGIHDPSRRCHSGGFLQSSLAKTHPSPKLPRRVLEQYRCHALHSTPLRPVSPNQQRGRRKSRSVSPHHHRPHQHHQHHPHHRDPMMSQSSVHGSPTLPLRPNKSPHQQVPAQLEWRIEQTLRQEGINLKEEPYSNKMGFCGIPPALVQRYAEELEADVSEVAACLESLRVRDLVSACRCWFRSDTLASQSVKSVYAGTGSSVEEWLTSLGLPMYAKAFTHSGWDELDIVIHMDKDDLRKCGIDQLGHLRRLSTALEHLKMSWKPV